MKTTTDNNIMVAKIANNYTMRCFDYEASNGEATNPIGFGATAAAAIADLREQMVIA